MKNFRVQIRAYGYYADFNIVSEDNDKAFENALVDKLGQNDIVWEKDGFSNPISKTMDNLRGGYRCNSGHVQETLQSRRGSRDRVGGIISETTKDILLDMVED